MREKKKEILPKKQALDVGLCCKSSAGVWGTAGKGKIRALGQI